MRLFDIQGRAIVVTGGASGIGAGKVDGLLLAGARVAIWDLPGPALEDVAARLDDRGIIVPCDITDAEQLAKAVRLSEAELGPIRGCFANAGVGGPRKAVLEYEAADWQKVLRINIEGTLMTLRAVGRAMVASGQQGAMVATASLAARSGAARSAAYAASKAAVLSLVNAMAVELARHRIRVHALLPGWIETGMTRGALATRQMEEKVLTRIPMKRWGQPDDSAGLAVYLMSDASSYQTGGSFVVDGGYSLY